MDNLIGNKFEQEKELLQVPDLNWMELKKDNIPTELPVEAVPQLQEAWTHSPEKSANFIDNKAALPREFVKKASDTQISDVIKTAKMEMMNGYKGKTLAGRLAGYYEPYVIKGAKDRLIKLAEEQGLLGNVYIDITPYKSCKEAARALGRNRIRTARYVVGEPSTHACASHHEGFCKELGKKVVAAMDYSKEVLKEYTDHLRVAGILASDEYVDSKESLREAFLRTPNVSPAKTKKKAEKKVDMKILNASLAKELEKSAEQQEKFAAVQRFLSARPILAHMQNQMLKGINGEFLKESLQSKFSSNDIKEYAEEIAKVANLQGIMGNIYVDVSYYKSANEAIDAIKTASTNPIYLTQTYKENPFDNTLFRVATATGCTELPKNGKIDKKIAYSYISDLSNKKRLASDTASGLMKRIVESNNILSIIRDAFMASQTYKAPDRQGGERLYNLHHMSTTKAASNNDEVRKSVQRAVDAGVSIEKIENKLSSMVPAAEAISMVYGVVANTEQIDANCLPKCTIEKYQLHREASIKEAEKCKNCILKAGSVCSKQGVKFAGSQDLTKAFFEFKIDPHTEKVQLDENPDLSRADMHQSYDMTDNFGSGMNITLEEMSKKSAVNPDIGVSFEGIDGGLV